MTRERAIPLRRALPRVRPRRARALLPLAALVVIAFLYYQPLTSYLDAKREVSVRQGQVERLRRQRAELELRLEQSRSLEVLAREARRVGYIRPGEQLYIVKGIAAWKREHGR